MADPGFGFDNTNLSSIPIVVRDELPADCRAALEQAAGDELDWRAKWFNESIDGHRANILSSVDWYPK